MRRIAITGISGYIGSQLLERLAGHPDVETIVGIDARPPRQQPAKLRFFLRDVAQPMQALFTQERVDAAFHLAFVLRPNRDEKDTHRVNIEGTRHFLDAALAGGVEHVLYLGSTAAYGAHADNPIPLVEEAMLRPNRRFQYSRDKAATDQTFREFAVSHPKVAVTLLRGSVVLGPGGAGAIGAKVFQPVMVRAAGHDPLVQYLHEEDLVDLLITALEQRPAGVYNVAGDGVVRYTEVGRMARRPMVAIPKPLLAAVMDATWALRLQSQSTSAGLDFIAHPWVAANEKFKQATGFSYRYSTVETVRSYLKSIGR
ncbi:MAG: NAD-dependent epimerase/dehydratase family protein [Dehalococcoidia bacterium]